MPELPEVETACRGIRPHIEGKQVRELIVRNASLRWPVPEDLAANIEGRKLLAVRRRAKYILLDFAHGTVIMHLGMSGSLRICRQDAPVRKHDHVDLVFNRAVTLRLHDPRRFGCVLWSEPPVDEHDLLSELGPEPLDEDFDAAYLHRVARGRKCSIKALIMNSHIVVGVGNIYASESLFLAGINPKRKAGSVSLERCEALVASIRATLKASIDQGGTTLRDFLNESGNPGYFAQRLHVYGREHEACHTCGNPIKQFVQQQRSTCYCTRCQR